jgi:NAD(P)-dependent dehydrogenase (short-subunit alcohol dehydrogenase family)
MDPRDKNILITGAGRGLGQALVTAALEHGARKVYAAARTPEESKQWRDPRIVTLTVDITDGASVQAAAVDANDTDLLINNAGVLTSGSLLSLSEQDLRRDMDTNFFGTLRVIRAFLPVLAGRPAAAIANLLSISAFAGEPPRGAYSASKAALYSATQSLRAELRPRGISVHGVFPGPVETEMARDVDAPKTAPEVVARNLFAAIAAGVDDILPDDAAMSIGALWRRDPKAVEAALSRST